MENPLSEDEQFVLNHYSRWGSTGYPIHKGKWGAKRWWINGIRGLGSFPIPFATKREAQKQWERYIQTLIDRKAGRL